MESTHLLYRLATMVTRYVERVRRVNNDGHFNHRTTQTRKWRQLLELFNELDEKVTMVNRTVERVGLESGDGLSNRTSWARERLRLFTPLPQLGLGVSTANRTVQGNRLDS